MGLTTERIKLPSGHLTLFMLAALLATSLVPSFTAHAQYGSGGAAIYWYYDVPNQSPLLPQPPRPPRPQRQFRGYPTEVGYQGLGFCKGVVNSVCGLGKLAYAAGDLTYGAVQCAGMAVGCGAYALGAVDDPARLVPANPGSLQSEILTSYDDSCKNGQAVKAYGGAVINIATFGIIPLYEAFEDTCETGSDELMKAIGGAAVGVVPVTRVVGPLVRRVRGSVWPPAPFVVPPGKKLVIDIGCGRESQLAAILDPSEYHVVGIDPLLSPGKQGFCGSIFDFNLIELLENRCDLVVLTGAKTGNTNTAYLSDICSRFIKRNGRVVVIDQYRGRASSQRGQTACNPDTTFFTEKCNSFLDLIDGCPKKGSYPMPLGFERLLFRETCGNLFKEGLSWRSWVYQRGTPQ